MSDFRKPRADTPIVPQSALFRKVKKAPKKPKGRRGRKPKGKRSGNFVVPRQDPNFILRKEEDDARKAREDRQRQTQQQERLITAQIADITNRRGQAAGQAVRERQQIQIAQDRFALDSRVQREQLRLQGESNADTQRYRAAQLAQNANQSAARAREAEQARRDSFDVYNQLRQIYRQTERRQGEHQAVMKDFLQSQRRAGRRLDPATFRSIDKTLDLSPESEEARESTAGDFAPRASAEQRRQRRQRKQTPQQSPEEELREDRLIQDVFDEVVAGSPEGGLSSSSSSAEEVLSRAAVQPRILRGDPDQPERFGEFATDQEAARRLGGQRRQPPSTTKKRPTTGTDGSQETQRRGEGAGRLLLASQLVRGAAEADARRAQENIAALGDSASSQSEPELGASGILVSSPSGSEASVDEGLDIYGAARTVGGAGAGVVGGGLRGLGGLAAGVGQGAFQQLPTAQDTGAFIGRQGYRGIVAAGGLIAGAARGGISAATSPRTPAVGEQTGGTLTYQGQP